ncbi:short transient receptor potential channel 3-like [Pollicipes pollicipes]|uniref:short transient receptor potential channel 3-like n=1 Tax=Pollicipes pollicipes TaxID=41117 RepID=UPI0018855FEE|nr:short transient receptor potential channel 3-like [Pollicipes pollicipes]
MSSDSDDSDSEAVGLRLRLSTSGPLRASESLESLVAGRQPAGYFHPATLLPALSDEQNTFMALAFLAAAPGFDVSCAAFDGATALHVAVERGDAAMVALLLGRPEVRLADCALYAVASGDTDLAELLLSRLPADRETRGYLDSAAYTPDITPLTLAAHNDDYEMIQLLVSRGHRLHPPHAPTCFCAAVCFSKLNGEDLAHSLKRLNTYRALASPAYICQTSPDPIYTCFTLAEELRTCAEHEMEFHTLYSELSAQVRQFAVKLIDYCRTTEELELIVTQRRGCYEGSRPFRYPRILMAVDLGQKEFVAHPKVQQVFTNLWLGRRQRWRHHSLAKKVAIFVFQLLLLPLTSVFFILAPRSKLNTYWDSPINKWLNWMASYVVFLLMIVVSEILDEISQVRGPPDSGLEFPLMLWVISITYSHARQCWRKGFKRFFGSAWHWYDTIMLCFFYLAFVCWAVSGYDVRHYNNVHLHRKFWHQYDPTLVGESFTAVANILAFIKLLYVFQLSATLGPLQISLGKMISDVGQFLVLFAAVVVSFSSGMNRLFDYYKGMVRKLGNGDDAVQMHSFVNLRSAFRTLFWTLFGLYDLQSVTVVIENLPGGSKDLPIINSHGFTEAIGYILFAAFHVLCGMIIMNMLIAVMTCTFHEVHASADIEWKFARSKVWITFILEPSMPPPFNLIPSVQSVWRMFSWLGHVLVRRRGRTPRCDARRCCYQEEELRYFRDRAESDAQEAATAAEVDGLLAEVQGIKAEVRDQAWGRQRSPAARAADALLLSPMERARLGKLRRHQGQIMRLLGLPTENDPKTAGASARASSEEAGHQVSHTTTESIFSGQLVSVGEYQCSRLTSPSQYTAPQPLTASSRFGCERRTQLRSRRFATGQSYRGLSRNPAQRPASQLQCVAPSDTSPTLEQELGQWQEQKQEQESVLEPEPEREPGPPEPGRIPANPGPPCAACLISSVCSAPRQPDADASLSG